MLKNEVEIEETKENPDYAKLQVIDKFKKLKSEYIQFHLAKNARALDEDPELESNAHKNLEIQFL